MENVTLREDVPLAAGPNHDRGFLRTQRRPGALGAPGFVTELTESGNLRIP